MHISATYSKSSCTPGWRGSSIAAVVGNSGWLFDSAILGICASDTVTDVAVVVALGVIGGVGVDHGCDPEHADVHVMQGVDETRRGGKPKRQ